MAFTFVGEEGQEIRGKETPKISKAKSVAHAGAKGVIRGLKNIESMYPSGVNIARRAGLLKEPKWEKEAMEKALPSEEGFSERLAERTGRLGTEFAFGGASLPAKIAQTGIGALIGQTAEELGAPDWAQNIAEILPGGLSGLGKKIPSNSKTASTLDFLRKRGFSENEIAPFLNSEKKLARLQKFASKGEKTNKLMKETYSKFENVFSAIRDTGEKLPGLRGQQAEKFVSEFESKLSKIPKFYKRKMKEEIEDLLNSPMKYSDFLDFNQAVNAQIGNVSGGKAVLGILKEPIKKAQKEISPSLFEETELANKLYGKHMNLRDHLAPGVIEDFLKLGEAGALVTAVADQNLGLMTKVFGTVGARKVAREMLINPKLQNISSRMRIAIKKNNIPLLVKLANQFKKDYKIESEEKPKITFINQ